MTSKIMAIGEKKSIPVTTGGDGTPEEILRKAIEEIKKRYPPLNAMIIAWYSENEKGNRIIRYLFSNSHGPDLTALISDLAFENHISRRSIFGNPDVYEVYQMQSKKD